MLLKGPLVENHTEMPVINLHLRQDTCFYGNIHNKNRHDTGIVYAANVDAMHFIIRDIKYILHSRQSASA